MWGRKRSKVREASHVAERNGEAFRSFSREWVEYAPSMPSMFDEDYGDEYGIRMGARSTIEVSTVDYEK